MTLLLVFAAVALVGAAVALWRLPPLPRAWPLLALATAPQLLSLLAVRGVALFVITALALAAWCWCNRTLPGVALVSAGFALNLLAMGLHGGSMPLWADSLAALGHTHAPGTVLVGSKDVVVDGGIGRWLGDWLVISWLPVRLIVSPGDLLILAGVVRWLLSGVPGQRPLAEGSSAS